MIYFPSLFYPEQFPKGNKRQSSDLKNCFAFPFRAPRGTDLWFAKEALYLKTIRMWLLAQFYAHSILLVQKGKVVPLYINIEVRGTQFQFTLSYKFFQQRTHITGDF